MIFVHDPAYGIMETMRNQRLILALFAASILFSMVREWHAPIACARSVLISASE
jgi:hypothetical protein